jgi:hypothetical protein
VAIVFIGLVVGLAAIVALRTPLGRRSTEINLRLFRRRPEDRDLEEEWALARKVLYGLIAFGGLIAAYGVWMVFFS